MSPELLLFFAAYVTGIFAFRFFLDRFFPAGGDETLEDWVFYAAWLVTLPFIVAILLFDWLVWNSK